MLFSMLDFPDPFIPVIALNVLSRLVSSIFSLQHLKPSRRISLMNILSGLKIGRELIFSHLLLLELSPHQPAGVVSQL